jgi:23S rRNA pseudouridine1911/1915/1917 synthase
MALLNRGFEFRSQLGSEASGVKIIDYLERHYSQFTREVWIDRIESGRVLLDGIASNREMILRTGVVLSWMRPPWEEPEAPCSFAILYQDACLLGVAKPNGLPTIPGGGGFMDNTLLSLVRIHFPGASPLHRLGRGTSGIVLFAITPDAASKISREWRSGAVMKIYLALASGRPVADEFEIDIPIGPIPHPMLKTIYAASPVGKPAHSHVNVLERREDCSLLQVRITTGRPHQIRIHLAAAGHPLVGDPLYIAGGIPAENSRSLPGDLGYHLHSSLLGFPHPYTNQWVEITCPPPPQLRRSNGIA